MNLASLPSDVHHTNLDNYSISVSINIEWFEAQQRLCFVSTEIRVEPKSINFYNEAVAEIISAKLARAMIFMKNWFEKMNEKSRRGWISPRTSVTSYQRMKSFESPKAF